MSLLSIDSPKTAAVATKAEDGVHHRIVAEDPTLYKTLISNRTVPHYINTLAGLRYEIEQRPLGGSPARPLDSVVPLLHACVSQAVEDGYAKDGLLGNAREVWRDCMSRVRREGESSESAEHISLQNKKKLSEIGHFLLKTRLETDRLLD